VAENGSMAFSGKRWTFFIFAVILIPPLLPDVRFDEAKYPTIPKAIHGNILSDRKSAIISWDPPKEEGEVIIARSNTVIDTPEKLYIADSLGRYKSGGSGGIKNYYDYNLKPGTFFYAIAMVSDVRKREVKLFANQNYSTVPVTIEDIDAPTAIGVNPLFPSDDPRAHTPSSVSDLKLTIEKRNIRLDWHAPKGAVSGKTIYTIYRSATPLTSLPLMQKAIKLTEVGHPTQSFLDQGLEKSQTLYYGVSVKEGTGEESLPLEDKKSTVRIFYVKNTEANTAELIPDDSPGSDVKKPAIVAPPDPPGTLHVRGVGYERVGKGMVMSWLAPEGADDSVIYSVYASTGPLDQGASSFSGAVVKVASINHPKTNFYIKELKEINDLYFGITAKSNANSEDFNLKENVSFFKFDFGRDLAKPEETDVTQSAKKQESQKLDDSKNTNLSSVSPAELRPLGDNELKNTDNLKEFPATVVYNLADEELNSLLRETVFQKKYELGVYRIQKFLALEKNSHLLGKAYFYLAISYLKSGETRKALKYFMKQETKSFSPDRAEFWTNQTLEKLGRGKV
jgi:hypothetical protein